MKQLAGMALIALMVAGALALTTLAQPTAAVTQWEYMTVRYYEFDHDFDDRHEPYTIVDRGEFAWLMAVCVLADDFAEQEDRLEERGKSQSELLALFGQSGWEMVQYDNTSTQFTYSATIFFKRPVTGQ